MNKDFVYYFDLDSGRSFADEIENLKKYNVIYNKDWCHGFRIIPRNEDENPLIELLVEDDECLSSSGTSFDLAWAERIIEGLQEVVKYCRDNNLYVYEM